MMELVDCVDLHLEESNEARRIYPWMGPWGYPQAKPLVWGHPVLSAFATGKAVGITRMRTKNGHHIGQCPHSAKLLAFVFAVELRPRCAQLRPRQQYLFTLDPLTISLYSPSSTTRPYSLSKTHLPPITTMASETARTPFPVTVHPFTSPTANACAYETGPSSAQHALVFIGGLTGGPHTLDLSHLSSALAQSPALDYALWEFRMRSSYSGFGYSSLANDVEDIAALVQYLRGIGKKKIVLMGASTGMSSLRVSTNPSLFARSGINWVGGCRVRGLSRVHQPRQTTNPSGGWVYPAKPSF